MYFVDNVYLASEYLKLAIEYHEIGDYAAAIASYNKAIEIKPDLHEAWYNRAIALGKLGRFEDAIASCEKMSSYDKISKTITIDI
jgi:tetratricopeptide (TPR) repeat protein